MLGTFQFVHWDVDIFIYPEPFFSQVKEKPGKEDRKASKAGVAPCSRFGDGTLGQKGTMASWLLFFWR